DVEITANGVALGARLKGTIRVVTPGIIGNYAFVNSSLLDRRGKDGRHGNFSGSGTMPSGNFRGAKPFDRAALPKGRLRPRPPPLHNAPGSRNNPRLREVPMPPTREDLATQYLDQLPYTPYPVQEEALLAWFTAEQGVLVCAPTGTG